MTTKRIIPCLDVKDGRTVKGVNFINFKDAGDPVEMAKAYVAQGADELVLLDITATVEKRKTFIDLVRRMAEAIQLPFAVGGGIASVEDAEKILNAGASKVSINSAAVKDPDLINEMVEKFGSKKVVVAIDVRKVDGQWKVVVDGGNTVVDLDALEWSKEVEKRGAGEVLLTSMDHDGVKNGFALDITGDMVKALKIPVIASGGAGNMQDFVDVFKQTDVDAGLGASVFHFGEVTIPELKALLKKEGIAVR
ncbi:MAG: imidazole glycerol phosphate synthase subunit HisF [Chitinophagales bacterium]|nr:imidazole glycerol phosphate synthase subunit HisF [Chitinophagales bacterium]